MDVLKQIKSFDKISKVELYKKSTDGTEEWQYLSENGKTELLRLAKIGQRMQWIAVSARLPENKVGKYGITEPTVVLCTDGKGWYKAYYVKYHEINCEDMLYEGDADYDEATDSHYWSEGWYECSSENEDTDWALGAVITHWMPLPKPPAENDRPEGL